MKLALRRTAIVLAMLLVGSLAPVLALAGIARFSLWICGVPWNEHVGNAIAAVGSMFGLIGFLAAGGILISVTRPDRVKR